MKKILFLSLVFISSYSQAVPNFWVAEFMHGFDHYSITNSLGQTLKVTCNSMAGDFTDHEISVTLGKKTYSSEHNEDGGLSLLLDEKIAITPPTMTTFRISSNTWENVRTEIPKAKKIEVFYQNKKVAIFNVNQKSVQNIQELAKCLPMSYRDK